MSKQSEREAFFVAMSKEGVPLDVARLVLRHAATLQRLAELACSSEAYDRDRVRCPGATAPTGSLAEQDCLCRAYGSYQPQAAVSYSPLIGTHYVYGHGTVPRGNVTAAQREARIRTLLAPFNVVPVFSGDPRGAVVKLVVPSGRTDDWGETGLCVPA